MTDPLTTPGTAPNRNTQTKEVFDINMATRLAWQETNVSEMNVLIPIIDAAVAAAPAAIAAGGATKWVSGTAVTQQQVDDGYANWSPTDGQTYRLTAPKTSGENVTDPAVDSSGDWEQLSAAPSQAGELPFTADGGLSLLQPFALNPDGTATAITDSLPASAVNTVQSLSGASLGNTTDDAADDGTHLVTTSCGSTTFNISVYSFDADTNEISVVNTYVLGTELGETCGDGGVCYDPDTGRFIFVYRDGSSTIRYVLATLSAAGAFTFHTSALVAASAGAEGSATCEYDLIQKKAVLQYRLDGASDYIYVASAIVTGGATNTLSSINQSTMYSAAAKQDRHRLEYCGSYGVVGCYSPDGASTAVYAKTIDVSGSSPAFGSQFTLSSASSGGTAELAYDSTNGYLVVVTNNSSDADLDVEAFDLSDLSSVDSLSRVGSSNNRAICYDKAAEKVVVSWRENGSTPFDAKVAIITLTATAISLTTELDMTNTDNVDGLLNHYMDSIRRSVALFRDRDDSFTLKGHLLTVNADSNRKYLAGFAKAAATDGVSFTGVVSGGVASGFTDLVPGEDYGLTDAGELQIDHAPKIGKALSETQLAVSI